METNAFAGSDGESLAVVHIHNMTAPGPIEPFVTQECDRGLVIRHCPGVSELQHFPNHK